MYTYIFKTSVKPGFSPDPSHLTASLLGFCPGALASRVKRKDTLALKLSGRPCAPDRDRFIHERSSRDNQPPGQTGLTWQSREQWEAIRTQIGTALTR